MFLNLVCVQYCTGQEIVGTVVDRESGKGISGVAVVLLTHDSTFITSSRTGQRGSFRMMTRQHGSYILLVSSVGWREVKRPISIASGRTDIDTIALEKKSDTLPAVIVAAAAPVVKLRGDTLEFSAGAVKVRPNSTVASLISRLPGFYIDQNGTIFYNGQPVQHLQIDGEDVFGDKPAVITRSFNADMIDKIQLLDRKDKLAELSGVDNGNRSKTINLLLNKRSKNGYFGKGQAGGDMSGYYDYSGMLGYFKDDMQALLLGLAANTGSTGMAASEDIGGGLFTGVSVNDPLGASAGSGVPQTAGAALHFADKWANGWRHMNGNVQYSQFNTQPYQHSVTRQVLPDTLFTQQQTNRSYNRQSQEAGEGQYDFRLDSLNTFFVQIGGLHRSGENQLTGTDSTFLNGVLANTGYRQIRSSVAEGNLRVTVAWRTNLHKPGRNLSIHGGLTHQDNSADGFLYAVNHFSAALHADDTTDQRKQVSNTAATVLTGTTFTEPLGKAGLLELAYNLTISHNNAGTRTFVKGGAVYDLLVDSLSSTYQNTISVHQGTVNLQLGGKKASLTAGGDFNAYSYTQQDLLSKIRVAFRYSNITPKVFFRYKLDGAHALTANYIATTQVPSLSQLQPVQNNLNPVSITVGNPSLRPALNHIANVTVNHAKKGSWALGVSLRVNSKDISNRTNTDSLGRQVTEPVNVPGGKAGGLNFSWQPAFRPLGASLGLYLAGATAQLQNYTGQVLNHNTNANADIGLSFAVNVGDFLTIDGRANLAYTSTSSSVNPALKASYWAQNHTLNGAITLPYKIELATSVLYNWIEKTTSFTGKNATFIWNAGLQRSFVRDRLIVKWQANDLLRQNIGLNRAVTGNQTTETYYNTISRYWMFSVSYRFKR